MLFVHVKHAAIQGLKTCLVISTDTDVVVLAIFMVAKLEIDKLWIAFGKGNISDEYRFMRYQMHLAHFFLQQLLYRPIRDDISYGLLQVWYELYRHSTVRRDLQVWYELYRHSIVRRDGK